MKNFILIILISSCQSFDNKPQRPLSERLADVAAVRDAYCDLAKERISKKGYSVEKCDGLLFTALHSIGCGYPDLDDFEGEPGQWFRSPTHDCYANGGDSTISKDMYAGLLLHTNVNQDGDRSKRMLDYCEANMVAAGTGCQVGEADTIADQLGKTVLPPSTITILEDMVEKYVEGNSVSHATETGSIVLAKGFEAHLQVIGELNKCNLYGGVSDRGLEILRKQAERQPGNALFQAAYHGHSDGNMEPAVDLFLSHFPADRLPNTSTEYCSRYLYERDQDSQDKFGQYDWQPCTRSDQLNKTRYGTDAVFTAAVILGELHQ